jgi:hypothetical protein
MILSHQTEILPLLIARHYPQIPST